MQRYEAWVLDHVFEDEEQAGDEEKTSEECIEEFAGLSAEELKEERKELGVRTQQIVIAVYVLIIIVGLCLCILPGRESRRYFEMQKAMELNHTLVTQSLIPKLKKSDAAHLASILGVQCQYKLSAMQLTTVAYVLVALATIVPLHILFIHPHKVVAEFARKGTLQCVNQDVITTRGRVFGVALFTAGTLLIMSTYTLFNYRCWIPWHSEDDNPLRIAPFQHRVERRLRALWCFIPSLALIFAATIPNKSEFPCWMWVNSISTQVALGGMLVMETVQLAFGEKAFAYFFSAEPTPFYGPLTFWQRARCVVLVAALGAAAVHYSLQARLKWACCGRRTSWTIASYSFYSEVLCLTLVMALPCVAGIETYWEATTTPTFYQALGYLAWWEYPEKFGTYGNINDLSFEHLIQHQHTTVSIDLAG
jgi:hypothetical protein